MEAIKRKKEMLFNWTSFKVAQEPYSPPSPPPKQFNPKALVGRARKPPPPPKAWVGVPGLRAPMEGACTTQRVVKKQTLQTELGRISQ